MLRYLVLDPIKHRNFGLGQLRAWQMLQSRTNGALVDGYVRMSSRLHPRIGLPRSPNLSAGQEEAVAAELRREGCAILPWRLDQERIDALRAFAFATPAFSSQVGERIEVRADAIPTDRALFRWHVADLIANKTVQDVVLGGPFASIAQDYLGCRPHLSTLSLWLNPAYQGLNEQFVYHYDNDGPKFLKFFIFLTDVEAGSGAHYFIKGSHRPKKPGAFARARRFTDEELTAHYGSDKEFAAVGPAGTILAEDTLGFHRGSTITRGYRMLLQLQYSIMDIATEEDLAGAYAPHPVAGLDPGLARTHAKFWRRA